MIKKQHVLGIILPVLSILACSDRPEEKKDPEKIHPTFLQGIKTVKAAVTEQEEEIILTGKVEYDPEKVIRYTPLISGIVEQTYFFQGEKVIKGQTLMDIKSAEPGILQAEKKALKLEIEALKRELQSAEEMYKDDMLSEKELLEAKAKLNRAESESDRIQTSLALIGTEKSAGVFSIKAPIDGYIISKNTSAGSPFSAGGEALFTIADLSSVWIMGNVYAGYLPFVKEGMEVIVNTLSYPDEVFRGKIDALAHIFDPEEKVLKARIIMPNKELKLKPEMSVLISLKGNRGNHSVAIPTNAMIFDNDQYHAIVEKSPGTYEIREILSSGHAGNQTYILSGIEEGELIVVKDQLFIYSGLKDNDFN